MRRKAVRAEIQGLLRRVPFKPFLINLENGDRIPIQHPENIAFDPPKNGSEGSSDFSVISGEIRLFSSFEAVTSVALKDTGED